MTKLRKLDASDSGINDLGIDQLNLIELMSAGNPKITKVNHMTKLKRLNINDSGHCAKSGINSDQMSLLNLVELSVSHCDKIKNIQHMTNLVNLDVHILYEYEYELNNMGERSQREFLGINIPPKTKLNILSGLNLKL